MTTVVEQPQRGGKPPRADFQTKVSRYDLVYSAMVALVVIVGFFAALLGLIWLTMFITIRPRPTKVIAINELRGGGNEGLARDMEEPGVEELPDVQEPQLADALEAMTDAISSQKAAMEAYEGGEELMGAGGGPGDSREPGPGSGGDLDVVPPYERWEIKFATKNAADYAAQLDFFGVELGAVDRKTPNVEYARSLTSAKPYRRRGTRDDEQRLYFLHSQADPILSLTQSLCSKAGINTANRLLAQFYSDEAFSQLLSIETAALGNKSLAKVRRTVFGVRKAGAGYEFYVISQEFMPGA